MWHWKPCCLTDVRAPTVKFWLLAKVRAKKVNISFTLLRWK
jgi:hypothetical protein